MLGANRSGIDGGGNEEEKDIKDKEVSTYRRAIQGYKEEEIHLTH